MGDSGSNLLGLLLACVAIQGVLKTAAVVALFFPLVILAVPALDATFVVAKRIKYRRPVYSADPWHFHHRFANIGFSPAADGALPLRLDGLARRAGAGAALRSLLRRRRQLNAGWALVILSFFLIAVAASVYLVFTLEILKFKPLPRAPAPATRASLSAEDEIEHEIEREVETGEFEAIKIPDSLEDLHARVAARHAEARAIVRGLVLCRCVSRPP